MKSTTRFMYPPSRKSPLTVNNAVVESENLRMLAIPCQYVQYGALNTRVSIYSTLSAGVMTFS